MVISVKVISVGHKVTSKVGFAVHETRRFTLVEN